MKFKKRYLLIISCLMPVILMIIPFFAIAQDPGGGPDAPIDGGLSILLAAGAAYGVKKYRDAGKKNAEIEK